MIALYLAGLETPTATIVKAVMMTGMGCLISAYGEVGMGGAGVKREQQRLSSRDDDACLNEAHP